MKKTAAVIIALSSMFSLFSCAHYRMPDPAPAASDRTAETSSRVTEAPDSAPAESSPAAVTDVISETEGATSFFESETATETETEKEPETTAPPVVTEKKPEVTGPNGEKPAVVDGDYVYFTDVSKYLPYITVNDKEHLILVNRDHPVPDDYVPENMVKITDGKTQYTKNVSIRNETSYLEKYAAMAYLAVMQEMKHFGITNTKGQSCFRSYQLQYNLYNKYIKNEKKAHPKWTDEQVIAEVNTYSAIPGTSEHHTGLALDFSPISNSFAKSAAYRFLSENGYKFGFILRYSKGMSEITGYMYEPWHWRFVGREAATYIYEHGLTLEEYTDLMGGQSDFSYHAPEESVKE
ncbi:MAG: M15 family metallopeptidase [Clostridia bacterium]|nr:M15 family metallopeptidase [Clostridia bacterium]